MQFHYYNHGQGGLVRLRLSLRVSGPFDKHGYIIEISINGRRFIITTR